MRLSRLLVASLLLPVPVVAQSPIAVQVLPSTSPNPNSPIVLKGQAEAQPIQVAHADNLSILLMPPQKDKRGEQPDALCFTMRTYHFTQDPQSDVLKMDGYTTCQPADKVQRRNAQGASSSR